MEKRNGTEEGVKSKRNAFLSWENPGHHPEKKKKEPASFFILTART